MIKVFTLQLDEKYYDPVYMDRLLHFLPEAGRVRVQDRLNPSSKLQTIAGELLARYSIAQFTGKPDQKLVFRFGEKGKPHIENLTNVHFNISHSGYYVVCAVAATEIGIDVERVRKVNLRVAERFFSESEIKDLLACDENKRMHYFITLWTIKESYLKAIGRGLTQHLNSFTILKNSDSYLLTGNKEAEGYSIGTHELSGDYLMAVCAPTTMGSHELAQTTLEEITASLPKYI